MSAKKQRLAKVDESAKTKSARSGERASTGTNGVAAVSAAAAAATASSQDPFMAPSPSNGDGLLARRGRKSLSLEFPSHVMPQQDIRDLCSPCRHRAPPELTEPFAYLCSVPGKDIRSKLLDCFNLWLDVPSQKAEIVKKVVAMLHNASLLIDDIEDNSVLRRGQPVAHAVFGMAQTINCANYIYFLALELVQTLGSPLATKVFMDEMLNLHRGQGWDIYWRDNFVCPSLEMYKQMVCDKTGGLLRLAIHLLQACAKSNVDTNFRPLIDDLSMYYQIRDDLINLASRKYHENKSFCEDLTEGKFSFPIIHSIKANESDHRLINILKQRTESVSVKQAAVEYIKSTGSLEYTRNVLKRLEADLDDKIAKLGGNEKLQRIVSFLKEDAKDAF